MPPSRSRGRRGRKSKPPHTPQKPNVHPDTSTKSVKKTPRTTNLAISAYLLLHGSDVDSDTPSNVRRHLANISQSHPISPPPPNIQPPPGLRSVPVSTLGLPAKCPRVRLDPLTAEGTNHAGKTLLPRHDPRNTRPALPQRPNRQSLALLGPPNNRMVIEKIVCGDGSRDGGGSVWSNGVFYGCPNIQGGREQFTPIDMSDLFMHDRNRGLPRYSTVPPTESRQGGLLSGRGSIELRVRKNASRPARRAALRRELVSWLSANKGFAVIIGGPGAREATRETHEFFRGDLGEIFMSETDGICLEAAIVNGAGILKGSRVAAEARRGIAQRAIPIRSVRQSTRPIQSLGLGLDIRRPSTTIRTAQALLENENGVFIVRVVRGNETDHVFVVDCGRGLIFDSAEKFPLTLTGRSLQLCSGQGSVVPRIAEIREMFVSRM